MTNIEQFTQQLMLAHDIGFHEAKGRAEEFYKMLDNETPSVLNDWISVDDRLPEYGQEVVVYRPSAHIKPSCDQNIKICKYDESYILNDQYVFKDSYHKVTHWQPLPSPPKGK